MEAPVTRRRTERTRPPPPADTAAFHNISVAAPASARGAAAEASPTVAGSLVNASGIVSPFFLGGSTLQMYVRHR